MISKDMNIKKFKQYCLEKENIVLNKQQEDIATLFFKIKIAGGKTILLQMLTEFDRNFS